MTLLQSINRRGKGLFDGVAIQLETWEISPSLGVL